MEWRNIKTSMPIIQIPFPHRSLHVLSFQCYSLFCNMMHPAIKIKAWDPPKGPIHRTVHRPYLPNQSSMRLLLLIPLPLFDTYSKSSKTLSWSSFHVRDTTCFTFKADNTALHLTWESPSTRSTKSPTLSSPCTLPHDIDADQVRVTNGYLS